MTRVRAQHAGTHPSTPGQAGEAVTSRLPRLPLAAALAVVLLAMGAAWLLRPAQQRGSKPSASLNIDWDTAVRLHGPVRKHGPLAMLSLLGAGADRSQLVFPKEWQQQRLAGAKPRPPPLCTILWNDEHRLIFLKCAKNAGNSVAHYFGARWQGSNKPTALNVLEPLWHPSLVAQLLRKWQSYTVFTFVRHPLRRAFSQYAFMLQAMAASDEGCYVRWDDFCRDPFVLGDKCVTRPDCCRHFNLADQYFHLLPQASCLLTEGGQLAVDFVGRVESFEEDFAALLAFLNSRQGVPKVPVGPAEVWNANRLGPCQDAATASRRAAGASPGGLPNPCNQSVLFEGAHAHCRGGLAAFYADDMRLLFPPPGQ